MMRAAIRTVMLALLLGGATGMVAWAQQGAGSSAASTEAAHLAAIEVERQKLIELMDKGPLVFRRVVLVTEIPTRFGEFTPRAEGPFAPGETMHIYIEPVGLAWKPDGETFRFEVSIGFDIELADGRVIAHESDFGRIAARNRDRPTEVMTYLTLAITDAPPGHYVLAVRLDDKHSGKTANFRLPFEVAARAEVAPGVTPALLTGP